MSSGKQSKRRARKPQQMAIPQGRKRAPQPRAARPKVAPPARRRASTKVLLAAAGVVALVGVSIALVAVLTRGSGSEPAPVPSVGSLQNALPGAADVERLFSGIPQQGSTLGRATAPVTLVEYVDMQCPFCREYATEVLPALVTRYVRNGQLRIESRTIAILGPDSVEGQQAVIAAGEQRKSFNLQQLLFFNQGPENTGWLSDDLVTAAAASIPGLRVPELLAARESPEVAGEALTISEQTDADNVESTPTIMVGKTGGPLEAVELSNASDVASITAAIEAALE